MKAAAFVADLGDPAAVGGLVDKVRADLGAISVIEWTAYSPGSVAGDLLAASDEEIRSLFDTSIRGLLAVVRSALPDLKREQGALLVTNGAAGFVDPTMDDMVVRWGMMGLGVANAAKHKLVGLLAKKLAADGIYVGEIMIGGTIKGTAFDRSDAMSIDSKIVADKYWEMYTARKDVRATLRPR
ncbi:MAG: SDR family oxidoreductase [Myxococcales bacterium]|nr:SDR family oxidoreductase [Myxococcales bacterium]